MRIAHDYNLAVCGGVGKDALAVKDDRGLATKRNTKMKPNPSASLISNAAPSTIPIGIRQAEVIDDKTRICDLSRDVQRIFGLIVNIGVDEIERLVLGISAAECRSLIRDSRAKAKH